MPEERKLVTILFADVTGSTQLGDALDPEDIRALMGRYYAHARQIVSTHGGTLEKFIGDAVMAIFGLPQAHGDDAERALAVALALREAVRDDEVLGTSFQLRIGVNTGEVVATSDHSEGDFLVTGDAVNIAARLQQCARSGEIIAGERTASAALKAFFFDDLRLIEVKGKGQPLRIFPLKEAHKACTLDHSPLVGRKQDLLQLSLLRLRVLEEQQPQLVSVVAPAGIGKTRLLQEFLCRLDPEDRFQVATVQCLPYGQTSTYWPLRSLFMELLGGEVTIFLVVRAFSQGGYKLEDAVRIAKLVLIMFDTEEEATTEREDVFVACCLLIGVLSLQSPLMIIFEDLHYTSNRLLKIVEYISRLRTQAPLLLITLSRPEFLHRCPTWGGGQQNFTSLALQPLKINQIQDLVKRQAPKLSEEAYKQITARSGGNPFFALELIHSLSEQSLATPATPPDILPDTIHAAILARLDLLSEKERTVLQAASLISSTFSSTMLNAILDEYSPQEIDIALDGLLAQYFIVPTAINVFAFHHVLTREVAYGTLLRSKRIHMHRKIAAWLESSSVAENRLDASSELIAYHYREVVQLGQQSMIPVDVRNESARATHFLKQAGELASRTAAGIRCAAIS